MASPTDCAEFSLDIFTAIIIGGMYYPDDKRTHYEMVLRTLELFFRVKNKVRRYPGFILELGCFVVSCESAH